MFLFPIWIKNFFILNGTKEMNEKETTSGSNNVSTDKITMIREKESDRLQLNWYLFWTKSDERNQSTLAKRLIWTPKLNHTCNALTLLRPWNLWSFFLSSSPYCEACVSAGIYLAFNQFAMNKLFSCTQIAVKPTSLFQLLFLLLLIFQGLWL